MKNTVTILDGAMGTMLQKTGLDLGKLPEALNITNPEAIIEIQRQYVQAGAEILYANTFGANRRKAAGSGYTCRELIFAGIQNARKAAEGTDVKIALSCGPLGALLEPNGDMKMEEAYSIFRESMEAGRDAGADLIVIETVTDLLEMKAALLAAKECCSLPVYCTMSFETNGRTFTGVSIPAMAATLEGLGADAIGINCSLGPLEILPLAKELLSSTSLPVIIKPNAGLPNLNSNEYDIGPQEFAEAMGAFVQAGVSIIGGCCGTTPEYISLLAEKYKGHPLPERKYERKSILCSASKTVVVDGVRVIGERINPTGKKLFKEALRNRNIGYILNQGIEQVKAGAHILDVNVGLPDIDECEMMAEVVKQLQSVVDVPLQLDSNNPKVLEKSLRLYNGKPIVNSVNGEDAVLESILPLVKKYGAAVVGLTLDETGIPETAEGRFSVAQKIVERALSYGIPREDIYIDCLTLTASVQPEGVRETLKAMELVKKNLHVKTVLGVSNISFGLPSRELINVSFLTLAMAHGLDLPILNPNAKAMMNAIDAFNVLYGRDPACAKYIERHAADAAAAPAPSPSKGNTSLRDAVKNGLKEAAGEITRSLLATTDPMEIVNTILIPALDEVGNEFESGKLFLPQLIQSAGAAQAGFEEIRKKLSSQKEATVSKGKIILATVKGDIHDIGKNIVKVILENYGYEIIDLGRDVPPETVVKETIRTGAKLVGLSALMTTTVPSMQETIRQLRAAVPCTIMVGGAVLTEDYAMEIGADFYAKDAKASADIAKKVLG